MTAYLDLPAIETWPLSARLANDPSSTPWAVLAVPAEHIEAMAAAAAEHLESLLDVPVRLVHMASVQDLLDAVQEHPQEALVLLDVEGLSPEAWRRVDGNRSRLARDYPALLVLEESRVPKMLEHAPNLWSWIASSVWRGLPEGGLSNEQREQRLAVLREHFGFGDGELVRRAQAGTLPPEPDIAEWLVLIGEGRQVGR